MKLPSEAPAAKALEDSVRDCRLRRWIVLGAGTIVPAPRRAPASHLLELELEGRRRGVLFDLGPGALSRVADAGFALEDVRHVLLSHFHPDHSADLVALLFAWKLPRYRGLEAPVIWGPKGLADLVANLGRAWGSWVDPGERIRVREIEPREELALDGLRVTGYPTLHTRESLAYRVESPRGTIVTYSGDTGERGEIAAAARAADLLVIECAAPDGAEIEGHLAPAGVARIAAAASPRHIVLTHAYPEVAALDPALRVRERWQGPVWAALDGWSFAWDRDERVLGPVSQEDAGERR